MKPHDELLNDRLEHPTSETRLNKQPSEPEFERDQEIDELVALARRLQQAPQIQVEPDFARQLERRLIRRHTELRLQGSNRRQSLFFSLRAHPVFGIVLSICLLFWLVSCVLVPQVSNPNNPLYAIKRWEQHLQISLAGGTADQGALDLQFARERLNTLSVLADASHEDAYREALADLEQQLSASTSAINSLPAGTSRDHLTSELTSLKTDTVHVLRSLLPRLTFMESLMTTNELAHLGDRVPYLKSATLTFPAHPNGQATVILVGNNIQTGAQLLVDGRLIEASGILQIGQITFVVDWNGNQHPQSLGIINPDGTVAQITTMIIKRNGTSGTSGGSQSSKGNKPTGTPIPSGKGNKPTGTPNPNRHKPSATPTPHH